VRCLPELKLLTLQSPVEQRRLDRNAAVVVKEQFAALIKGGAMAATRSSEYGLDRSDGLCQLGQLGQLSAGELFPTLGWRGTPTKTEKQLASFLQGESDLLRSLDDCQPIEHSLVVAPLLVDTLRGRQYPNLFVIADRRGPEPDSASHFRNGQEWHG
jgi:hypothetical protein